MRIFPAGATGVIGRRPTVLLRVGEGCGELGFDPAFRIPERLIQELKASG